MANRLKISRGVAMGMGIFSPVSPPASGTMRLSMQLGHSWAEPIALSGKETGSPQYGHLKSRKFSSVIMMVQGRTPAKTQLTAAMPSRNSMLLLVFFNLPSSSSIASTGGTPVSARRSSTMRLSSSG